MKTFINQNRFLKAVEYVSENIFSKPYSITPMIDRWFNQQAVVEFTTGELLYLSDSSRSMISISIDGISVPSEDICLVEKFKSPTSSFSFDKEKAKLIDEIEICRVKKLEFEEQLKNKKEKNPYLKSGQIAIIKQSKLLDKKKALESEESRLNQELEQLIQDAAKANDLYEEIVAKGKSTINEKRIEAKYDKIKNIIYRPNHDLSHSVRAAYLITAIHSYRTANGTQFTNLTDSDLEKLQMMMLFSVVGRRDETGSSDPGNGLKIYESYRTTSGREYLKYFQTNKKLYGDDIEVLYRDAIVVELMGYSSIADLSRRTTTPEVFIDYVIAKELSLGRELKREEALDLIKAKRYSIDRLFPAHSVERALADSKLKMMNDAHALDLTRCYSLTLEFDPDVVGSANSIKMLNSFLAQAQFYSFDSPDPQRFTSFYKLIHCGFDTMALTGQETTFGLLSPEEFEKQKPELLKKISAEFDAFKIPPGNRKALIKEGREKTKEIDFYFGKAQVERTDAEVFLAYRQYRILKVTTTCLTKDVPALIMTNKLFAFQHSAEDDPHKVNHHKNATSIVHGMQTITPMPGVLPITPQIIPAVTHGRDTDGLFNGKITAWFDTREEAVQFIETCADLVGIIPDMSTTDGKFGVEVDAKIYEQFITDGLAELRLPVISSSIHERDTNGRLTGKVTAIFDDQRQAEHFKNTYRDLFLGESPIIIKKDGTFQVQVDRKNFKQLVKDQLVEFKRVTIPKEVSSESSLIDEEGNIDVLNLVKRSRALVRLVSTTALSGEDFPDYEYLFNALEDPVKEKNRYAPRPDTDLHDKYYHPRTAELYHRTVVETPMPPARFQEPIYEPPKLIDKEVDGWVVGAPGGDRNTIFTKKLAHSLLPPHGKIIPFKSYPEDEFQYFPIGILSDRKLVDMKDERYVWTENMATRSRFWLTNPSQANKYMYRSLHAQLDSEGLPKRNQDGVILLDKESEPSTSEVLVKKLERRADKIIELLDSKFYRPTDEIIEDCRSLIEQSSEAMLKLDKVQSSPEASKGIIEIYDRLRKRLDLEANRKHQKYGVTVRELIEQQKEMTTAGGHNEILASNTKSATQALYACEDTLIARLNVAFNAMKIKQKYHYDVPLMVMSQGNAPYHYTEAMIKADLKEAYEQLVKGEFPYDTTLCEIYERDENNKLIYVDGDTVVKKNEQGEPIKEPKNLKYQQGFLVDLFKLGLPKLEKIDQLVHGDISGEKLDKSIMDGAIDAILAQMDVLGGLARETKLMHKVFKEENATSKEKFFLRAAALGHKVLIDKIVDSYKFRIPEPLLDKAAQFAAKNNHQELSNYLKAYLNNHPLKAEKKALEVLLRDLNKPIADDVKDEALIVLLNERSVRFIELNQRYSELNSKLDVSELGEKIYNLSGSIKENDLEFLRKECLKYIGKIKEESWGSADKQTEDYCKAMSDLINHQDNKDNFYFLSFNLQELQKVEKAVTSPEMLAVKGEYNRIKENVHSIFQVGNPKKAATISAAVCKVSLLDRAHIFSNEKNSDCNEVRKAFAAHRVSYKKATDSEGKVIENKAAETFKKLNKQFPKIDTIQYKQRYQTQKNKSDTESSPDSSIKVK
jgi:hypothetical protein